MRFALAKGSFVKAQGFLLARDKRYALLDMDTLSKKMENRELLSITLALEREGSGCRPPASMPGLEPAGLLQFHRDQAGNQDGRE